MSAAVESRRSERVKVLSEKPSNVPEVTSAKNSKKATKRTELLSPTSELNAAVASLTLSDDRLPAITNILMKVNGQAVQTIAGIYTKNKLPTKGSKAFFIEAISDAVWTDCLSNFYNEFMNKGDKEKAAKSLSMAIEAGRGQLKASLIYAFKNDATALPHILEDIYSDEQLEAICEGYHVDVSQLAAKEDKVNELVHGMRLNATTVFYTSLNIEDLKAIALLNELKSSGGKQDIVYRLVHQKNEEGPIPRTELLKAEFNQGDTFEQIYAKYNLEELKIWCKENDVKSSGTKKELIHKVLRFLDGDKEGLMIGDRKIPRRRRNTDGLRKKKQIPKENKENAAPVKTTTTAPAKKTVEKKTTTTTSSSTAKPSAPAKKAPAVVEPVESAPLPKRSSRKAVEPVVEEVPKSKGKKAAEPVVEEVVATSSGGKKKSLPKEVPVVSDLAQVIEGLKNYYDVKPPRPTAEVTAAIKSAKKNGFVVPADLEAFYSICDGLACTQDHVTVASIEFFGINSLTSKEGTDGRLVEQVLAANVEGDDEECLNPDQTKKFIEIANGNIDSEDATYLYLIAQSKSKNVGKIASQNKEYEQNVRIVSESLTNALEDLLSFLTSDPEETDACALFTPDVDGDFEAEEEEEDVEIDAESEKIETFEDFKNGIEDVNEDDMQE